MGWTLSMASRPKEAIDYVNRGMRLDPQNPSAYLALLGMAHFCMGEVAEAASLTEEALRLNPENMGMGFQLAAFYGLLGHKEEARAALATVRKKLKIFPLDIMMMDYPFKDRAIADRYAEGLLKAGVPGQPSGYLPAFKRNQLTGEQIKALLFGSTIMGVWTLSGQRWWADWEKNGECAWRGAVASDSDRGNSRIEGDMICTKYQKNWWGLEDCATVFRNPSGTSETKDAYFFVRDIGFRTFSPAR
jgi:tetratricopeptide (TPR) repeat protein